MIPIEHRKPEPLEDVLFLVEYRENNHSIWGRTFVVGFYSVDKKRIEYHFSPPFIEYPANQWGGEVRVVSWAELPIMPE